MLFFALTLTVTAEVVRGTSTTWFDLQRKILASKNVNHLDSLADDIVSMLGSAQIANMPNTKVFVDTTIHLLDQNIGDKIRRSYANDMKELDSLRVIFKNCLAPRERRKVKLQQLLQDFSTTKKVFKKCKHSEKHARDAAETCVATQLSVIQSRKALCDDLQSVLDDGKKLGHRCHNAAAATYRGFVYANTDMFEGWIKRYNKKLSKCSLARAREKSEMKRCAQASRFRKSEVRRCKQIQGTFELNSCTRRTLVQEINYLFTSCHSKSLSIYRKTVYVLRRSEKNRQAEFRSLQRIICLLKTFNCEGIQAAEVVKCKKKEYYTTMYNLRYWKPPVQGALLPQKPWACTPMFLLYYHGLPVPANKCRWCEGQQPTPPPTHSPTALPTPLPTPAPSPSVTFAATPAGDGCEFIAISNTGENEDKHVLKYPGADNFHRSAFRGEIKSFHMKGPSYCKFDIFRHSGCKHQEPLDVLLDAPRHLTGLENSQRKWNSVLGSIRIWDKRHGRKACR